MHPFPDLVREVMPRGLPLAITLAALGVLLLGIGLWIAAATGLVPGASSRDLARISAFTMPMAAAGFLLAGLQDRRDPARVVLLGLASLLLVVSGALVGAARASGGWGLVLGGVCWGLAPAVLVAAFALPAVLRILGRSTEGTRPPGRSGS
ncbi:MAG: hypothetical protein JXB39_14800 [Deltaproteobacteria bacterium]|nr:hypothetical protein [Deltaproteobacteria bacterium]